MKVAYRGHHRQEGIQEGEKKTKKQKRNKPGQPHIICVGQERQPYMYIYKWCRTAQIGRQSKDKDNECATQRNKMKEGGKGYNKQIK